MPGGPADPNRLLSVRGLHTYFNTYFGEAKAVRGVSFDLDRGQVLGIVGETGSGKSVTALSLVKLVRPPGRLVRGTVLFKGRDLTCLPERELGKIRGKSISMIFQNPRAALNPLFTVSQQMYAVLDQHRPMPRKQREEYAPQCLAQVGLSDPERRLRQYPHELSTGMCQRVMIAIALSCEPELLIADEPTTGVDVTLQAQLLALMSDLVSRLHMSVIIITHDMGVVAQMTQLAAVMYAGRIVELGPTLEVLVDPRHPYTRGLLSATLRVDKPKEITAIRGVVPDIIFLPSGCPFHPRCDWVSEECSRSEPEHRSIGDGRIVACHHSESLPHTEP